MPSLKGYVVEPVRVGGANAASTPTPANLVSPGPFAAHYPDGSEPVPRTDYLVLVQEDGLLASTARFGWTKNEVIARFDYAGQDQRFVTLPGLPPETPGLLGLDANTTRLKVTPPQQVLADAPFRLSVGPGVGTPLTVALVSSFGAPAIGTVELLTTTGELNWNTADLAFYEGLPVRFQRQSFAGLRESDGRLGLVEDVLLLCPLPAIAQYPLVRLGYGPWLTPVARANDAGLTPSAGIASGTVEWSASTGLLRFSAADLAAFPGSPVFYDGVLFGWKLALPTASAGLVTAPALVVSPPPEGGDLIFRLASGYQFPTVRRVVDFDDGVAGEVQLKASGFVQFSIVDQQSYGASAVTLTRGDLPLERGLSLRLGRSPLNLDGLATDKDVACYYDVENATWADPIVGAPQVYLPSLPLDGPPITVTVEQGTGSFTGPLPRLDTASPPAGLGYILDFSNRQLVFAQRRTNALVERPVDSPVAQLPDPLVQPGNLVVGLEVAAGSGVYSPLTLGTDALLDAPAGLVSFLTTQGQLIAEGVGQAGATLTDPDGFTGVQPGDYVIITGGPAKGIVRVQTIDSATQLTLDVALPTTQAAYTIRRGVEILADRAWLPAEPVDPSLALDRLTPLGAAVNATVVQSYVALTFPDAVTVQGTGFLADGVRPGDTLRLTTGPDSGSARILTAVTETRLTVDRPFTSLTAANATVERRLRLQGQQVRLGAVYVTPQVVATDSAFGFPAQGVVQVSQETGNLHFAVADLGKAVTNVARLVRGKGYRVTAGLGFVELTERLLAFEEVRLTYRTVDETGQPSAPITEMAAFLVPKELTNPTPRPAPTTVLAFNPTGRTLASLPPAVYRGGRPQTTAQVTVNTATSTLTFVGDAGFMTDALPHGAVVAPDERVYVDYYVTQAFGGERTFTVQQPPLYVAMVSLQDGADSFVVEGDQTSVFPAGYLMRVEQGAVYRLQGSSYDGQRTTIALAGGEVFADDAIEPTLAVTSGPVPLADAGLTPSYFIPEAGQWGPLPRGANRMTLAGDRTLDYQAGVVVCLSSPFTPLQDFLSVVGASYDEETDRTTVTFTQPLVREARSGSMLLRRSVRPIVEVDQTTFRSRLSPVVTQGYTVARRRAGQVGELVDTTVDDSGSVMASPLGPDEALLLFYTGYRVVEAGRRLQVSYTSIIAPNASNGLAGQVLLASHTLFSPDTFYFRVETLTNFKGEVTLAFQKAAQSQAPTAGPMTSNASGPKLYEQGRPSMFFEEGHLDNVDRMARALLLYFHQVINRLDDVIQSAEGTVVGGVNGRFRFDGNPDNPPRLLPLLVTNDIDDRFQISPFPPAIVWNPPAPPTVTYLGTFLPLWQPSSWSRLFPTRKDTLFGLVVAGSDTGATTGQAVVDLGQKGLTKLPSVAYRRLPRALVTRTATSGSTTLTVDNAQGTAELLRPSFAPGMKVVILAQDGTSLVSDASPLTVSSVLGSPERLVVGALPVAIPAGSTVLLCVTGSNADTTYPKSYRLGTDLIVDPDAGTLVYVEPYFPFDGSVPGIPSELNIQTPSSGEILQLDQVGVTSLTTKPYRFPALDGLPFNDSGDQAVPFQSPTPEQEAAFLDREATHILAVAGAVAPVAFSATVNAGGTVMNGAFPGTSQVYDLVRFLTGPNAAAGWRRLSTVAGTVASVDAAWPSPSSSGQAIVTAAPNVAAGTATFSSTTVFSDGALSAAVQPGMTVVFTSGLNTGLRRQVVARLSSTQVQLHAPVVSLTSAAYRVHNPLNTFSDLPGAELQGQRRTLTQNDRHLGAKADAQALALTRFFEGDGGLSPVLEDIIPLSTGTAVGTTLTDPTQDFVAAGVGPSDFVYIETGLNRGFWPVVSVTTTTVTITGPFPSGVVVSYRVVRAYGVGKEALQSLFTLRQAAYDADLGVVLWQNQLASQSVTVGPGVVDATFFATGLTTAQVTARQAAITARQAAVAQVKAVVGQVVGSRDKLYDKRWSWITARVDGQDGLLYQKVRAAQRRIEAQIKLVDQLMQIASLEGAS